MELRTILLPTDDSAAADEALDRAVCLSDQWLCRVRVLHVELGSGDAAVHESVLEKLGSRPRFEVRSVRAATAYRGIVDELEAYQPDLLMMATHGGRLMMDGNAERLVREAPCNVLTTRRNIQGAWPREPGRIVVPVDFSDNARRALEVARSLAGSCPIVLLHVLPESATAVPNIEEKLRTWGQGSAETVIAEGSIRDAVLEQVRELDAALVVLGAHGEGSGTGSVIGSTAPRLIHRCPAPVLTVR